MGLHECLQVLEVAWLFSPLVLLRDHAQQCLQPASDAPILLDNGTTLAKSVQFKEIKEYNFN